MLNLLFFPHPKGCQIYYVICSFLFFFPAYFSSFSCFCSFSGSGLFSLLWNWVAQAVDPHLGLYHHIFNFFFFFTQSSIQFGFKCYCTRCYVLCLWVLYAIYSCLDTLPVRLVSHFGQWIVLEPVVSQDALFGFQYAYK